MILFEDKEIRRKFLFINSIRIAVLTAFFFITVVLSFFQIPFSIIPIIIFILLSIVISFFHFTVFKIAKISFSIYFQVITDIIFITVLVYFSGGISSPFYFLYFLPIVVSSIFLSRRDTIYTAIGSYIVYGILSDLMYLKILKFYPGFFDHDISTEKFVYNLIMSFISFTIFAFISTYYFENIKKKGIELKNIQENLKDLVLLNSTVLDRMESGFIISNSSGKIISYNEKAKFYLNLKNNYNIFKILNINNGENFSKKIENYDNRLIFEKKIKKHSLEISASIINDIYSFEKILVFLISDQTKKKNIEIELKKKEHFALIGEMSAGIAHEIRNPLASISGSIQFLEKELKLDKDSKNLMDIIVKESKRLSDSIEEFLQFTKTSPLEKSKFDIGALISEVTELAVLNVTNIYIKKRYSEGNTVFADRNKIKQVVWNIINNSIKAIGNEGEIEINIFKQNEDLFLSIKDSGVGIKREEIKKIFLPFYSKFTSGIGLGMAIAKRIIDEHSFNMEIISEINKGTEVTICFGKN
ncbi:MAG: ATP-binding protein [Acidobacteriota bacterium]